MISVKHEIDGYWIWFQNKKGEEASMRVDAMFPSCGPNQSLDSLQRVVVQVCAEELAKTHKTKAKKEEAKPMKRKIYLAARYSRRAEMQGYRDQLEKAGHIVTARWIDGGHDIHDSKEPENDLVRFAAEDSTDIITSDLVISFTEAPRSGKFRGGRHVEMGIALGMNRSCWIVGPRENLFHHLAWVRRFVRFDEALTALESGSIEVDEGEKVDAIKDPV